jgi:hypothetical protein
MCGALIGAGLDVRVVCFFDEKKIFEMRETLEMTNIIFNKKQYT